MDIPRVVVNADDLGIDAEVNSAIADLMAARRITSASLMANGPAFEEGVKVARAFPHCSFGVHLNATQFEPLTGAKGWGGIVDNGSFNGSIRRRLFLGILSRLTNEWTAQVQRVLDSGIAVSHLDSHHHAHTLPWTFCALKRVQAQFAIQRVRNTRNLFPERSSPRLAGLKLAKKVWRVCLIRCHPITRTTDYFCDVEGFLALAHQSRLPSLGGKSIELMCHPGHQGYFQETTILRKGLAEETGLEYTPATFWNI